MAGFFETLIRPDKEELEMADRMVVGTAANLLQVGEFQFLQLAYREWHDDDMPAAMTDRIFSDYMLRNEVPHWARHYARLILTRADHGTLDENDTQYHRYDHEYRTHVPRGVQRFCMAAFVLSFMMVTSIILADLAVDDPVTMLPPYFDRNDLRPQPQAAEPAGDRGAMMWGRGDNQPVGAAQP